MRASEQMFAEIERDMAALQQLREFVAQNSALVDSSKSVGYYGGVFLMFHNPDDGKALARALGTDLEWTRKLETDGEAFQYNANFKHFKICIFGAEKVAKPLPEKVDFGGAR